MKYYLIGFWIFCVVFLLILLGLFENWSYVVFNLIMVYCGIVFFDILGDKLKLVFFVLIVFIILVLGMFVVYC